MWNLVQIDGSGWISATNAKEVFHFSEYDLRELLPCATDFAYRYYNRSDLEQLAHHRGAFMPESAAVDAVARGAYDPNDLAPRRKNLKTGTTWTKVMKDYKGLLTKRHQDMIKPFAITPNVNERARGQAIKRYDPKDVEALADRVASEPPKSPRKSPAKSKSQSDTSNSKSPKKITSGAAAATVVVAPVQGGAGEASSPKKPGSSATKRRSRTIDWEDESDEEYIPSPTKRSRVKAA